MSYAIRTCKCCGIKLPANKLKSVEVKGKKALVCSNSCKREVTSDKDETGDYSVGQYLLMGLFWPIFVPVIIAKKVVWPVLVFIGSNLAQLIEKKLHKN